MVECRGVVHQEYRDCRKQKSSQDYKEGRIQRRSSSGLKSWFNIKEKFIRTIEMVEYEGVVHQDYRDGRIQWRSSSGLQRWQNIEEQFIKNIEIVENRRVVRTIEMVEYRGEVPQDYRNGKIQRSSSSGLKSWQNKVEKFIRTIEVI